MLWQRLQAELGFELSSTLFVDDSVEILDSAKRYGIEHLIAIPNPDSTKPEANITAYPAVNNFSQLIKQLNETIDLC